VAGLAPDGAGLAAGRGLARPGAWPDAGAAAGAVWGHCRGSGKRPYEVAVDVGGPAFKCSCPSRKIPCKHVLGLLLLWADGEVPVAEVPPFVSDWLQARGERSARPGAPKRSADGAVADPAAREKRVAQRAERIDAGVAELDRWLRDLIRGGLAEAQARPLRAWDETAARLVDAQAPGLAGRVRRLGSLAHSGTGWPDRVLAEAGRLHLATTAWHRRDALDEPAVADLRVVVGWPEETEAVRAAGAVEDRWAVLGQWTSTEDERLRTRRTWLHGMGSGRPALLLAFAPRGGTFEGEHPIGSAWDGRLAFYPGAMPLRAVVAGEPSAAAPFGPRLPGAQDVEAARDTWAAALGANPWLDRWPVALAGAVPVRRGGRWHLADDAGALMALPAGEDPWRLIALSGGAPVDVFGEYDGENLWPLTVVAEERAVIL